METKLCEHRPEFRCFEDKEFGPECRACLAAYVRKHEPKIEPCAPDRIERLEAAGRLRYTREFR